MLKEAGLALTLTTLSAGQAMAQPAESFMSENKIVSEILADRIDRAGQGIGMAAALVDANGARFVNYGTRSLTDPAEVEADSVFEIGSITKVFTNLLLAQLVLEGKIDLDAPIATYLPPDTVVPERDGKAITSFDLATHTSGLPSIPSAMDGVDISNPYAEFGDADLLAALAGTPLTTAPGTTFEYSNMGAAVLGQVVMAVAGEDYDTLLQTRILDPLGMTDTALDTLDHMEDRLAVGHDPGGEEVSAWEFDAFAPAGGLRSTAEDMAKFIAAASGQVETPLAPAFAKMLERTRSTGQPDAEIGLGWLITDIGDSQIIWHNGGTGGYRSFAGYVRDAGKAVVVLSNVATMLGVDDIGFHLLDEAAPLQEFSDVRVAIEVDPEALTGLVGTYAIAPDFALEITAEDDQLFVQATGQERLEAFAESETEFFLRVVDAQLTFELGDDGQAVAVTLHQNGADMVGQRQ